MLPGTNCAADRFARASLYIKGFRRPTIRSNHCQRLSIIHNTSVPFGITTPDQPNIFSTRRRTVSDQKRKLYFFESALTPNVFWVDLTKLVFSGESGKVMKLDLGPDQTHIHSGVANDQFKENEPFTFLGL